jgi:hypothetical protein
MNSYLTKWKRQMQYNKIIEDLVAAIKQGGTPTSLISAL